MLVEQKFQLDTKKPSNAVLSFALQKLEKAAAAIKLDIHPIVSGQKSYNNNNDKFKLETKNYFGRLSESFINERLLKRPGDYVVSRTHKDEIRLSMMSEDYQIYHLIILRMNGIYAFENSLYPKATSIFKLIQKCTQSSMNVMTGILGKDIILRHMVDENVENSDDYNLLGVFLRANDVVQKKNLIHRGKIADCYFGKLHSMGGIEQVVIKVMHYYSQDELDNICRELHISNMLQHFVAKNSVISVRAVRLYCAPYMIIYPFMNCGSYVDFTQQMASSLTYIDKVKKAVTDSSKVASSTSWNYEFFLGNFRKAHVGMIKRVDSHQPIHMRWLAPEVFETKRLTAATDVYAWGVTLYEIFTGNLPYFSMNNKEIRTVLLSGRRIRPEVQSTEIPRTILKLMQHCWQEEANERPTMNGVWLRLKAIYENSLRIQGSCSQCDILNQQMLEEDFL